MDKQIMSDKENMLQRIYEVVWYNQSIYEYTYRLSDYERHLNLIMIGDVIDYLWERDKDYIIHWHVVWGLAAQHNLISWASYYFNRCTFYEKNLIDLWEYKRKPIEEQSIECIQYIYSLLPTNKDAI